MAVEIGDEVSHELQCPDDEHVHLKGRADLVDGVLRDVVHSVVTDLGHAQNHKRDEEPQLKYCIADCELLCRI